MEPVIIHIDMDAFFAAVEQHDHPEWRGKPVIVGALPKDGRGVVSAASYEARAYGVHSAMPITEAYRRCPHGIFTHGHFHRYHEISDAIHAIFYTYTPLVQSISIDEAFLDVTHSRMLFGNGEQIGRKIKSAIKNTTGLTASVGIAPSKFLAKRASEFKKPDGLYNVATDHIFTFLHPLPISELWGVGPKTEPLLQDQGYSTIGQLYSAGEKTLCAQFGKRLGMHLWWLANGGLGGTVNPDETAKSISHETTFLTDTDDKELMHSRLLWCADRVGRRLRQYTLRGKTIQIKIRFTGFATYTRAETLNEPTDSSDCIYRSALRLIQKAPARGRKVRLIGVGVHGLSAETEKQLMLFTNNRTKKIRTIESTVDAIQKRFGSKSIARARLIKTDSQLK